jgi:hypothetical protein
MEFDLNQLNLVEYLYMFGYNIRYQQEFSINWCGFFIKIILGCLGTSVKLVPWLNASVSDKNIGIDHQQLMEWFTNLIFQY